MQFLLKWHAEILNLLSREQAGETFSDAISYGVAEMQPEFWEISSVLNCGDSRDGDTVDQLWTKIIQASWLWDTQFLNLDKVGDCDFSSSSFSEIAVFARTVWDF